MSKLTKLLSKVNIAMILSVIVVVMSVLPPGD
jgi:hypothetical protein